MAFCNLIKSEFLAAEYELLRSLVMDNIEHFRKVNGEFGERFLESFSGFLADFSAVEMEIKDLTKIAHLYDFDAQTPGNGYRCIISVVNTFVELCAGLCQEVKLKRRNFTFSNKRYLKKVTAFAGVLAGLLALIKISQRIRSKNKPGELFCQYDAAFLQSVLSDMVNVERTCFYGRLNAFQKSLRFICLMSTSFSHVYYASGQKVPRLCSALMNFCRYSHSPSKLSKRFVKVLLHSSVDFCRAFWNLQGLDVMEKLTADPLAVNMELKLLPEPMRFNNEDGTFVDIPIPSAHSPVSSIVCRLVCANFRQGQELLTETQRVNQRPAAVKKASPYLIIHIHGSGYMAASPVNHKVYLNEWATTLDAPILCIYHSVAPEAPYPRPLEECLYAYAWAIKNCHRLGSTGEKICLAGSSAGGHLATSLIMRTIQLGLRKPDGLLAVAPINMTYFMPSPSFLLLLMDPLLPLEFGLACLEAYSGDPGQSEGIFANRSMDDAYSLLARIHQLNKRAGTDPLKSPSLVSDDILAQFPPTRYVSSHRDPLLDNSVVFMRRMKTLGKDARLVIVGNLPHGFLTFSLVSKPAHDASRLCIQLIRDILQMPPN